MTNDIAISKPGLIERFLRWLRLADYEEAKERATEQIIRDVGRD